jgi:DNA helicase II / ATP-dependent DNA helicase PcrA
MFAGASAERAGTDGAEAERAEPANAGADRAGPARPAWASELNPQQLEAVTHRGAPLLVVAGAGSGKTRTLVARVARLLEEGVPPERILLLTFTRRAAAEMVARAGKMSGSSGAGRVWGGTFHAIANRLLRIHGRAVGLGAGFTVMDAADSADLMNLVRGELDLGGGRRGPRKETLAAIYSAMVNGGSKLAEIVSESFPWCSDDVDVIRSVFEAYTARKRAHMVLDYDDLLLYWRALTESPRQPNALRRMFDHILVDEYQDTNALQASILTAMHAPGGGLMAVGDDSQAIYSFRAATVANMLDFGEHFPGARVVKLERNYRSTQPILELCNAVIAGATRGYRKALWSERGGGGKPVLFTCADETDQSDAVCRRVLESHERGVPLTSQAVLFRAGNHSALLEIELARRNIPFVKYGGLRFIEAAHVKDVVAFLRTFENPHDELSWFRILQLFEGVGVATARRLMQELGVGRAGASVPSPGRRMIDDPPRVPAAARSEWLAFQLVVRDVSDARLPERPAARIERLRKLYGPMLERRYPDHASRLRDIEALQRIAENYSSTAAFVSELTLDPPSSTEDLAGPPLLDEDYLILSTIHSAKGLEWEEVHVIHASDGMIPSDMALTDADGLDEERRVFYVALTRARRALYVHFPLRYYHHRTGLDDSHGYAQLTRFLSEGVRELLEERSTTGAEAEREATSETRGDPGGVDALLNSLWAP